ncbi:MAG: hypothetical protein BWK78_04560, partial [Thiotrichaceae bacterium IS1]
MNIRYIRKMLIGGLLIIPLQLLAAGENCIEVIAYGKNPETSKWEVFPTPCDVPEGWEITTTKPPELVEDNNTGPDTESVDGDKVCQQVITYAQHPTSKNWYIFPTPCDVPKEWTNTQPENPCAGVVIYGQSPTTNHWYTFVNACDLPQSWKSTLSKPATDDNTSNEGMNCLSIVTYAQSERTGNWYAFPNSCDIPTGWKTSSEKPAEVVTPENVCLPVIVYAQNPETKNWYAFSSSCDVPAGWIQSATPPEGFSETDCSGFHATYSGTMGEGKLRIPLVSYDIGTGDKLNFKAVELELLP